MVLQGLFSLLASINKNGPGVTGGNVLVLGVHSKKEAP
jgi:hypothetical protein